MKLDESGASCGKKASWDLSLSYLWEKCMMFRTMMSQLQNSKSSIRNNEMLWENYVWMAAKSQVD